MRSTSYSGLSYDNKGNVRKHVGFKPSATGSTSDKYPKPFSVKSIDPDSGVIEIENCWYLRGVVWVESLSLVTGTLPYIFGEETSGVLCAEIDTESGQVLSLVRYDSNDAINYSNKAVRLPLYKVSLSDNKWSIAADLRGSTVALYV